MATEMVVDNKVVTEAATKVLVVAMVVVAATKIVVMVAVMVGVVLVVAEIDPTTASIQNIGIVCCGKKVKQLLKPITVLEAQTM